MRTITLPWESWRAVIDVLRAKALPCMLVHPGYLEQCSIGTVRMSRPCG